MRQMNIQCANYEVRPGVVLSGRETAVRIIPRGRHARFDDKLHRLSWSQKCRPHRHAPECFAMDSEICYRVYFLPMQESREPLGLEAYPSAVVKPESDGSLQFSHVFNGEQEYKLIVTNEQDEGREELRLSIYSLLPDLYGRRVYRGDLHVHSFFSDGKEEPGVVAANYRKYGYDFMALTDHYKMYPSKMLLDGYEGIPLELAMFLGEEVHVPYPSYIHAINFGGRASVNEYYADHEAQCNDEIARRAASLSGGEEAVAFNALEVAQRVWVAEKIREFGGMSILVHPHWMSNAYNMPDVMTDYLFKHQVYDAFELLGGQSIHENNMQTALYCEERAKGYRIPVVGSTDSHGTEPSVHFDDVSTLVFAPDVSFDSLTAAIKDGYSAAVEEYQRDADYRLYGPYRTVKYGRYLMETYFPRHDEMCWEQGRLMKDYALGDPEAGDMLKRVYGRVERYAEEFFGY